ncbi:hypothetical protein OG241_25690 [Streptomyces sp. NBC_01390]|uniref:hypothetical protein n=1 Tax=Streptomyces sp. NBC_01390 TaxID=2903850 RepID=UPI003250859E
MVDLDIVEAVRDALYRRFEQDQRVGGVGIGMEGTQFVVRVHLVNTEHPPQIEQEIQGVPVRQIVTGRAVAEALTESPHGSVV